MLSRVRRALFAFFVLTLLLAGCGNTNGKSAAQAVTTTQAAAPAPPSRTYHSRPDLKPPLVQIRTAAHNTAPGYIFLAPKMVVAQAGPMIMDNRGEVVWFKPLNTQRRHRLQGPAVPRQARAHLVAGKSVERRRR